MLARQQAAAANAHQRHHRVVAVSRIPEHVAIAALDVEHDGGLFHLLEMVERIAQLRGALEVERLARRAAFARARGGRLPRVRPSRKTSTSSIIARYSPWRLREDARRLASLDEIVEAGPLRHLLAACRSCTNAP